MAPDFFSQESGERLERFGIAKELEAESSIKKLETSLKLWKLVRKLETRGWMLERGYIPMDCLFQISTLHSQYPNTLPNKALSMAFPPCLSAISKAEPGPRGAMGCRLRDHRAG
ncbi:MAG: hypothetical protein AMJ92_09900 [candidate division Zixibacteria bacterium SM23_81]|nr:MAG: hypothetical protein AMJ92_09900 [candidate division Zixibacteria bacterium SM23_81]